MKKTVKVLSMFLAMAMMFSTAQIVFAVEEYNFETAFESKKFSFNNDNDFESEFKIKEKEDISIRELFGITEDDVNTSDYRDEGEGYSDGWEFIFFRGCALITKAPVPERKKLSIPEYFGEYEVIGWLPVAFDEANNYEFKLQLPNNFPVSLFEFAEKHEVEGAGDIMLDMLSSVTPTDFKVGIGNRFFATDHGVLYSKDKTVLVRYPVGRDADFFYLPKKAKTFYTNGYDIYYFSPFASFIEYNNINEQLTVHVHEDQVQELYDVLKRSGAQAGVYDENTIMLAMTDLMMTTFMFVEDVCIDWDKDKIDYIDSLAEYYKYEMPEYQFYISDFLHCDNSHISDMPVWEALLMIFFFGWIWY